MVAILMALLGASLVQGLKFIPEFDDWNLNKNEQTTDPLKYTTTKLSSYHPSPDNWRFPFYTLFLDRLANGEPENDNINGTVFEQDLTGNQFRHGGDLQGLIDSMDYIQGMGMKVLSQPLSAAFS
ncbi:hypothetical protein GQ53DRAFT_343219 [Thozetella sp. PMI_491]|nr:hypothetical protein GQ53DRAFT_343219 [Thozetella sp. PMI_491]